MTKEELGALQEVVRDALSHQQAAYEGKIKFLRAVIHDLAGAFARLNAAVELTYRKPLTQQNIDLLEIDRSVSMEKFNKALDRLK